MFEPKPDPMIARDLIGYGEFPPNPAWPGGALIAVNFNLNIEGGGELSLANGDDVSEGMLNDIGVGAQPGHRVPLVESVFEYGSRRGAWRLLDVFRDFSIPVSVLAVARGLARISHTIFARSGGVARRFVRTCWLVASGGRERSWDFPGLRGAAKTWSRWAWDDAAVVTRCGGACHAGEPRALAAALRRTAAQPQTSAAGQLDAIAILMRRTLTRTSAPILSSLRRIVPQLALANGV